MALSGDHNRLIQAAAKAVLAPLGLRRRGGSRTWLDDHGWWLVVVEFQPSARARGTYLNVGAMWLWRRTDHLAFHYGHRSGGFVDAERAADPAAALGEVAARAADEVRRLRGELGTLGEMATRLAAKPRADGWDLFHAAIAAALAGAPAQARGYVDRAPEPATGAPAWERELWADTQAIRARAEDPQRLRSELREDVKATRAALRLPAWDGDIDAGSRPAA